MAAPSIRVVVRLPTTRPEEPIPDPPQIEWTPEKADILWRVIERSRSSDSGGADWKGLAAHLEVPLPYLLYRVNARFQEEIRGLKDIQDTLSPSATQPPPQPYSEGSRTGERPTMKQRLQIRTSGSAGLSGSSRLNTPIGVRARLNSLTSNVPRPRNAISSSTLTLQPSTRHHGGLNNPSSPLSSEGESDSDDELMLKEEEAERAAEEEEMLNRKLQELQRMMTNEAIGLVSKPRRRRQSLSADQGRVGGLSPRSVGSSYRRDTLSNTSRSGSQSVSDASSPQGSIPDIPSPAPESQPHSPHGMQFLGPRTRSPPSLSGRNAGAGSNLRYVQPDEYTSSYDSGSSSFTDLSDASLSGSALESALMSNIRGNGSRLSQFVASRGTTRSHRLPR